MRILASIATMLAAAMLLALTPYRETFRPAPPNASDWPSRAARLSVLTYNVRGLPWPVAIGRTSALAAIGGRLRLMRDRGVQPHIVLLQEAFTDPAKRIAREAGYRYVAYGPVAAAPLSTTPLGEGFASAAQWLKGERSGSLIDGGLMILSDYPIQRTRSFAFPLGACAGYDCLAAKGILVAWIKVPGSRAPVAVVDTHLNSRRSTHVAVSRADAAYAWQVADVRRTLAAAIAPGTAIIFGGDFNTGRVREREAAFSRNLPLGINQRDGLAATLQSHAVLSGSGREVRSILVRNKDHVLTRDGRDTRLIAARSWVPFGLLGGAPTMSDHAGFVIDLRLASIAHGLDDRARPGSSFGSGRTGS